MEKKTVAIIGGGRIGGALAIGLARYAKVQVRVSAAHRTSLIRFQDIPDIYATTDNAEAVDGADVIFLAVKPYLMESVVKALAPAIDFGSSLIVSIAPGIRPEELRGWLPSGARLSYAIPNTAIEMGKSMTFISSVTSTEDDLDFLKAIFDKVGQTRIVDWNMLLAGTALASCGIAYALQYIKASTEGGSAIGFSSEDSLAIVTQTVRGALAVLDGRGLSPQQEIDRVTTPGGMTLRGLDAMEQAGFTEAVKKGLQ